ncbi:hypothetical protein TIFTF001_043278 [Ficus carica]|uniref:Uncharacterized protein n=1 Tax=Ficus carica TaxID=3494 RepID=A0AA87YRZ1_FICCA|nr:hypothetical protein TIFTF001_043278 [Ficus carica]
MGWVMACDEPFSVSAEEIDRRIKERIDVELLYLSGAMFLSSATLNKTVALSIKVRDSNHGTDNSGEHDSTGDDAEQEVLERQRNAGLHRRRHLQYHYGCGQPAAVRPVTALSFNEA